MPRAGLVRVRPKPGTASIAADMPRSLQSSLVESRSGGRLRSFPLRCHEENSRGPSQLGPGSGISQFHVATHMFVMSFCLESESSPTGNLSANQDACL